ncbi:MAG: CHAT domain-containing protein [Saprospiraceae bacterium]
MASLRTNAVLLLLVILAPAIALGQQPVAQILEETRQKRREGALQQALVLANQALRAQEDSTGLGSLETAEILESIGLIFTQGGKYPQALFKLQQALVIREKHLDSLHLDISNCHFLIGNAYLYAGNKVEAQKAYERSLQRLLLRLDDQRRNLANVYNNIAYCLEDSEPKRSLQYHHKALALRREAWGEFHPETGTSHKNLGSVYWRQNNLDSATIYTREAIRIFLLHAPEGKSQELGQALGNMGLIFSASGQPDSAEVYQLRAVDVLRSVLGDNHPDVAQVFCSLATGIRGDVLKSRAYLRAALDILERSQFDTRSTQVNVFNNLAENHRHSGENEQAISWAEKGLALQRSISQAPGYVFGVLLNNLGTYHSNLGHFDTAFVYFRQSLAVRSVVDQAGVAHTLHNMGTCFFQQNQLDSALAYFSASMNHQAPGQHPLPLLAIGMNGMASTCLMLGKDSLALAWLNQTWENLKDASDADHLDDKLIFLNTLGGTYMHRYKMHAKTTDLEMARLHFRQGMELAQNYTFHQVEYAGLASVIKWIYQIAENGIRAEFHAYQQTSDKEALSRAWDYSEQTKAIVLHNLLLESRATHFASLPDSVAQALALAKQRLLRLEKRQLEHTSTIGLADSLDLRYAADALAARTQLNSLRLLVETRYPDFYRLRYGGQRTQSLSQTISALPSDQTLVAYFTGDSSLFAFVVRANGVHFIEVKKDFPIDTWIEKLREGIYGYYAQPEAEREPGLYRQTTAQYLEYASKLYQKLVLPLRPWLERRVIFVPDATLVAVPFEVLLTDSLGSPRNLGALPYLCHHHAVSYTYSASTLHAMQTPENRQAPKRSLLALAPFATADTVVLQSTVNPENRRAFIPLPSSSKEVETVNRIFGGDALFGKAATAQAFMERYGDYRILHLATHAQADPRRADRACLVFAAPADSAEKGLIYTTDLYGLALYADMVVLSACETGIGKIQHGEGAVSLARAFAAAGAKSVVHSLWVVNDAATTRLMEEFYSALYGGAAKDEALQLAKRNFVSTSAPRYQHPFFWAGFIATGDMLPLR